jgi:hypothetical protein
MEAAKGTTVATAATPPVQAVAMTMLRRRWLTFELSFMDITLVWISAGQKMQNYTETFALNQMFRANLLIWMTNPRARSGRFIASHFRAQMPIEASLQANRVQAGHASRIAHDEFGQ